MNKHILVIDGLRPSHKILKNLGAKLTLMSGVGRIKEADSKIYDRIIGLPKDAIDKEWLEIADTVDEIDKIDSVCAYHERNQYIASVIARKFGVEFNSLDTLNHIYNKYNMRKRLVECGLCNIKFDVVNNIDDIKSFAEKYGYPLILKPIDGWASIGISKINNEDDITKATKWYEKWAGQYQMYVEQFIEGKEYSVESFSEHGVHKIVCVTEKFKDTKHFVEIGHCLPANIDKDTKNIVEKYVTKVLNALNVVMGPTHTEIMVNGNEVNIVETHTRLGGDFIPDLIRYSTDINLMEVQARQTLGESALELIKKNFDQGKYAAIMYYTPEAIGVLKDINGIDEAKKVPGVKVVSCLQQPGDYLSGMHDSFSRTVYVIAVGDTFDEAVSNAQEAVSKIRCNITCSQEFN